MMVQYYSRYPREFRRPRKDIRAYLRVLFHQLPLLVIEPAWLQQYLVRNPYLPYVMEMSRNMYLPGYVLRHA